MIITFGQYSMLVAARQRITHEQLAIQTEFDELLISYFITGLVKNNLLKAMGSGLATCYELTPAGVTCMVAYEQENPGLVTVTDRSSVANRR